MRLHTILVTSILAACGVGDPPDELSAGDGTGTGDGTGNGDGTGGGSGSGTGGGGGGSMTATRFLDEMGKKYCTQAFTCQSTFPTDQGGTFAESFGTSAQACAADSLAYYEPTQVETQITAGKIRWNAADASSCLAGITFGTCPEFWQQGPNMPAACDTVLVGTVADGGACVTHLECTSQESYCDETSKCAPYPAEPTGA